MGERCVTCAAALFSSLPNPRHRNTQTSQEKKCQREEEVGAMARVRILHGYMCNSCGWRRLNARLAARTTGTTGTTSACKGACKGVVYLSSRTKTRGR